MEVLTAHSIILIIMDMEAKLPTVLCKTMTLQEVTMYKVFPTVIATQVKITQQ